MPTIDDEMRSLHDQATGLLAAWEEEGMEPSSEALARVDEINARMKALDTKRQARAKTTEMLARYGPVNGSPTPARGSRLGDLIVAAAEFKALRRSPGELGRRGGFDLEVKDITGVLCATVLPEPLVPSQAPVPPAPATMPLRVSQLQPWRAAVDSCSYLEVVAPTGSATVVAPGVAKPLFVVNGTVRTAVFEKVAAYTTVNDEQLEDEAGLGALLSSELSYEILDEVDRELLLADGTAGPPAKFMGYVPGSAGPDHTRTAAESPVQAILSAAGALYAASGLMPDSCVCNYATAVASASVMATGSGVFLHGVPSLVGPNPPWTGGLRLAVSPAMADGQMLVGNFARGCETLVKRGLRVDMSNSSQDGFVRNMTAIRAEVRVSLCLLRPLAFGLVTQLPPIVPA
jgi:Phage capsid family